tara:strand:+ start:501 stop:608 length:108 start_codon:yes stop_codon:yes gene_type:complete
MEVSCFTPLFFNEVNKQTKKQKIDQKKKKKKQQNK